MGSQTGPTRTAFAGDDSQSAVGSLSFENGRRAIVISGDVEITHDQFGLKRARELKAHVDAIVAALDGDQALPAQAEPEPAQVTRQVKNPFA